MCRGRIEIIMGCMFSGKSTEIIKIMKRYKMLNKKILAINNVLDNRYDSGEVNKIITHDKVSHECIATKNLLDIKSTNKYYESDVVVIEEAQFFGDLFEFVVEGADKDNKTIIVAGLDGDFKKDPFGDILRLIPHAEKVTKLEALCLKCGDGTPAHFTKRITTEDSQTLVGSSESYVAVCRKHFNSD